MDQKEADVWARNMEEYLKKGEGVDVHKLVEVLLQVKERLDTQMDAAVITAALCDLLVAKKILTEQELDDATSKLSEELSKEEK